MVQIYYSTLEEPDPFIPALPPPFLLLDVIRYITMGFFSFSYFFFRIDYVGREDKHVLSIAKEVRRILSEKEQPTS